MKVPKRKTSRINSGARVAPLTSADLRNEKRLGLILEAVDEGYWDWNIATGEIYYSQGWLASLGYSPEDLSRDRSFWESIIHPDDLPTFDLNLEAHLAGKSQDFDVECRLRAQSGHYLWFRNHGKVVDREKNGRPTRMVGTIVDVDERKQAQAQLATSQAHLSAIFESTDDLIWSVDPEEFRLLAYNRAYAALLSRTRGIAVRPGMLSDDLAPVGEADAWKRFYRNVLREGKIDCDYQVFSGTLTLHLIFHLLTRDGRVFGISVFGHDITERIRIEEALRKSEEKFAQSFLESPMAVTLTSARDHRYLEVNEAFQQFTGYNRDEVIGRTPFELGIWENPEATQRLVEQVTTTGHARNAEIRYRIKSGEIRDGLGSAALIEIDGEPCLISVSADITDRKRAEEALRDSEERLRLATESGKMYAFEWDPRTDLIERSPESHKILGHPQENTSQTGRQFVESIHADDRQRFAEAMKSLRQEKPQYKVAYRLMRPDQSIIWLEESGRAFFDTNGNIQRVVGMAADITEVRQSASALRELSGRLITSQEVERRRVARELHDNIGQELALLAVQARRVDSGTSDDQSTHLDVRELYKRIKDIATKVSTLSHQLHSSELDFLGLEAAAERLCRDFAKKYSIDADYEIRSVPRKLDVGVSLCFYRILQEALQNIARHSRSTRVAVELTGSGGELTLKISDNGIGFDMGKAQFGPGLGLISMRERMKLIGGRILITSNLEHGTTVNASVAIVAESTV